MTAVKQCFSLFLFPRARGEKCGCAVSADKRELNTTVTPAKPMEALPAAHLPSDSDSGSEHEMEAEPHDGCVLPTLIYTAKL